MYTILSVVNIFLITAFIQRNDASHDHSIDAVSDVGYTNIVYVDDQPKCSGTLLSRMWTITTCLCVHTIPSGRLFVRIGDPTLQHKNNKKYVFYKVEKSETHPDCLSTDNEFHVEHNVALLMLAEPVFDSLVVNIVKLPNQLIYWTPDSELGLDLASWIDMEGKAPNLHKAVWHMNSTIHPDKDCEAHYGTRDFKPRQTTCAAYHHKGGKNDCELDLGAPLSYDYILIGILAYKDKCGEGHSVGSFVNIPMHSAWIRQLTSTLIPWIIL